MLKINKKHILVAAWVLVVVNLTLVGVLLSININLSRDNFDKIADPDTYQAVFLSNDQIYFGHLKNNQEPEYLILTDVYYVKIGDDSTGQLVKLGTIEPHGPENTMIINKEQVLFWENLKSDSRVIKTIQSLEL